MYSSKHTYWRTSILLFFGLAATTKHARAGAQPGAAHRNFIIYPVLISDNYYSTLATIKFPHLATTLIRSLKL